MNGQGLTGYSELILHTWLFHLLGKVNQTSAIPKGRRHSIDRSGATEKKCSLRNAHM
jgi:hypothetical protein